MMKFYTAVGQYRIQRDRQGRQYPVVLKERQEFCLSIEEMIIWASSLWRIHTYDELESLFYRKEREAHILGDADFGAYLSRLENRGLIVSGRDITAEGALYDLLSRLSVVPLKTSFTSRAAAFIRLCAVRKIPLSVAKKIFLRPAMTKPEKRILKLSGKFRLSTAELIACFDNDVYTIATEQQLVNAVYGTHHPEEFNLKAQTYCSDNRRTVITAVANLYLKQAIMLQ